MNKNAKIKLREAFLEITSRCNFRCRFCVHPQMRRPKMDMDANDAKRLIGQIAESFAIDHLSLHLYGEPLLHDRVNELARYATQNRLNVNLTTNGAMLTKTKLKAFLDDNVWRIVLSIQHDEKDFGTRRAGKRWTAQSYFGHIAKLVQFFIDYKSRHADCPTRLEIHYLLTGDIKPGVQLIENDADVAKVLNWWGKRLPDHFKPESNPNPIEDQESGYRIQFGRDAYIRFKPAISFGNAVGEAAPDQCDNGYCFFPDSVLCILSDGNLVPCCIDFEGEMKMGNALESDIVTVWNGSRAREIRAAFERGEAPTDRCRQCLGGSHFGSPI